MIQTRVGPHEQKSAIGKGVTTTDAFEDFPTHIGQPHRE